MNAAWRFRLIRNDGSSSFVRRAVPFLGSIESALEFAERVRCHFGDVASRVEAWSEGQVDEVSSLGRVLFLIRRHENGRDWRLLEGRLTHPGWFQALLHAVDYAAFRGRGYEVEIRVNDGSTERSIFCGSVEPVRMIGPGVQHAVGALYD
jgi:hypothetical protein